MQPGFPRFKEPKAKKFGKMSAKTTARMEERKEVVEATHERSGWKCEASWIAPDIPCSNVLHCDEKLTRGRHGGVTAYDKAVTQSLCSRCDHGKENEVWAAEILGLYGTQGTNKHVPITETDIENAKVLFSKRKKGCHF